MTPLPDVIRQSDLLNQLILDRTTMEALGRVEVMWMYPSAHRVLGFVCKAGTFGAKKTAFKLAQISTLGANGILTRDQPEETDATKVRQLETLLHCEVWSETGNKIGKITDYLFNLKTGTITHYLLASSGWAGIASDLYQLPPSQVLSMGRKRVLVTEASAQTLAVDQSGIKQTLAKATSVLKEDYGQATEELRSLSKQAQAATEQAKGRFQTLTGQLKERARSLSQQAQETIQNINEQLQEDAQTIVEQAKENSQVLAERMKERTQTFSEQFEDGIQSLGEQVEDGIQTLTVQAKEILEPTTDDTEQAVSSTPIIPSTQVNEQTGFETTRSEISDFNDDDAPWIGDEPWIGTSIDTPLPTIASPHSKNSPNHQQKLNLEATDIDDDEPWI
ncbi:MAG: PRC-barrel domain-containing protein [Tildeniella nuda ZEHNDER 1965/U140]|jgi:uncharacterized protein YrrD|nr:PRC-barrel domain-containing protein [Tildeniella nuda ZEHNDER 1965/U140]